MTAATGPGLTCTYIVWLVNEYGEGVRSFQTNNCETALKCASGWFYRISDRAERNSDFRAARSVDVMKRNSQGDYDGLAAFRVLA